MFLRVVFLFFLVRDWLVGGLVCLFFSFVVCCRVDF